MADLVTLDEMKAYLGATPTSDDALLTQLLDDVQALFEAATLRPAGFYTADDSRTEVRDGTGTRNLYLTYPLDVNGLKSVTLGYGSSTETLNVADPSVLVYGEGSRCISRIDGGTFGRVGQPRYITVVYSHLGDRPENAALAIKSVVASVYQNRGSEGMKSETVGAFYSYTRDDVVAATATDPFWQQAVQANTPAVIA